MSVQYQVKSTSYLALDLQLLQLEKGIKLVSVSTVSISMNHDVLLMPIKLYRKVTPVSLVVFQCTIHPTSVQFLYMQNLHVLVGNTQELGILT